VRYEPRLRTAELHDRVLAAFELARLADRKSEVTQDADGADLAMAAELSITNAREAIAAVLHGVPFDPPTFPSGYWSADRAASDDPVAFLGRWFDDHATESPVLTVRYMIVHGEAPPDAEHGQEEGSGR
jgi:hypothetical protein